MNFEQVHNNQQVLLLQCISGSKAYGLDTPQSDTDIKGVFALGKNEFYGLQYTEQVANPSNDIVYYELKRFVELLVRNNPTILELLSTPSDKVLYRHPVMDLIRPEMFLSKLCLQSFAGYAQSQIKKAKGLNKKIFNPIDEKRKNILDFCYIIEGYSSIPLQVWLRRNTYFQENCGLINIPHSKDIYAVFYQSQTKEKLCEICSGDDAKNMMHTFRLLNMAEEIALEKRIHVFRKDREFLLKIRNGEFLYDDLNN
jgi:hypothetical protein